MRDLVCSRSVCGLFVGDIFYTVVEGVRGLFGPYTVTQNLYGEFGARDANGQTVFVPPDAPALSEEQAILTLLLHLRPGVEQVEDEAEDWIQHGFRPREVASWLSVGCSDAAVANAFRAAGIKPEDAWHPRAKNFEPPRWL
jgi:hypothetical protein